MEDYARAVALEKAAWEAVRHRLPGCAGFDQALWKRWRQAVDEADRAAAQARTLQAAPRPPLPFLRRAFPPTVRQPAILNRGEGGKKP